MDWSSDDLLKMSKVLSYQPDHGLITNFELVVSNQSPKWILFPRTCFVCIRYSSLAFCGPHSDYWLSRLPVNALTHCDLKLGFKQIFELSNQSIDYNTKVVPLQVGSKGGQTSGRGLSQKSEKYETSNALKWVSLYDKNTLYCILLHFDWSDPLWHCLVYTIILWGEQPPYLTFNMQQ